jgi:hypothetical protein
VPGPSSEGVPGPGTFAKLAYARSSSVAVQVKYNVPSVEILYHARFVELVPEPVPLFVSSNEVMTGTWFTILKLPLVNQILVSETLESHARALSIQVPFVYAVESKCVSQGVPVRLVTAVQFSPSDEISISILDAVPLPVITKEIVWIPVTSSPSPGPLLKDKLS